MIVYSEEQIKQAYEEGFKAGKKSLSSSRLLCEVLGIAKQEIDVYKMPDGDFAFANAGIISDGFATREQAEIAAYKAVLNGVILTIEAEHFA